MTAKIVKLNPETSDLDWQNILWREWTWCDDEDYARRIYEAIYNGPLSWLTRWRVRQQARPYAHEIETALHLACKARGGARFVWDRHLERLEVAKQKPTLTSKLIARLEDHHWLERFIARQVLLYRGGEVIRTLQTLALSDEGELGLLAQWLVESIGVDTTERLAKAADRLICPLCLVACHGHTLALANKFDLTYYGCRDCHRSHTLIPKEKEYVVVLDTTMTDDRIERDGQLRVNWLRWRRPFDFDRVDVVEATDELVERFAVQAGNDTDPVRKSRYGQIPCRISPTTNLSNNAWRVLDTIFGTVKRSDDRQ